MTRQTTALLATLLLACAGKAAPTTPAPSEAAPTPAPAVVTTPSPTPIATPEEGANGDSPMQVIRKYTDELRSIADPAKKTAKEKGVADSEREKKIAEKVRQFFDFPSLAKRALGRHWDTITPKQREEYSRLFIDLVEDSYLSRSRDIMGQYELLYKSEEVKANYARVKTSVVREDANIDIVYELHRNPKVWMIYNIVLDDVDLIRSYQTQFNRIIVTHSFNHLLNLMREKRNEPDKEVPL